ncbi:PREDICTED: retinoic acid receptor responder protein 1 [Dipodomys ordii]|uniref:Retinoic acid receptor responder protein 1 n=1 Tax=Dipodomys ordii TaxID=10020 RepID=A0A1S3F4S4_DIPOR|nr:PREDICTED: retinoic acid receptor responder protein 1 [Dipodomys ordii]
MNAKTGWGQAELCCVPRVPAKPRARPPAALRRVASRAGDTGPPPRSLRESNRSRAPRTPPASRPLASASRSGRPWAPSSCPAKVPQPRRPPPSPANGVAPSPPLLDGASHGSDSTAAKSDGSVIQGPGPWQEELEELEELFRRIRVGVLVRGPSHPPGLRRTTGLQPSCNGTIWVQTVQGPEPQSEPGRFGVRGAHGPRSMRRLPLERRVQGHPALNADVCGHVQGNARAQVQLDGDVDPQKGCKVELVFSTESYNLEAGEDHLGKCSAQVFFKNQKPRPAVNVTCTRLLGKEQRRQEDYRLYTQLKQLQSPFRGSLPDSHGRIEASLRPLWDLAFLGSSYVMWEKTTQFSQYYLAQLRSVNQWKMSGDAVDFDYTVLLHEFPTQEILPCRIRLIWYPGKPLKVKYQCQELQTPEEASGTVEGSAVAPTELIHL